MAEEKLRSLRNFHLPLGLTFPHIRPASPPGEGVDEAALGEHTPSDQAQGCTEEWAQALSVGLRAPWRDRTGPEDCRAAWGWTRAEQKRCFLRDGREDVSGGTVAG